MRMLITNGRIVDPASGRDKVGNLLIDGERIVALDAGPMRAPAPSGRPVPTPGLVNAD